MTWRTLTDWVNNPPVATDVVAQGADGRIYTGADWLAAVMGWRTLLAGQPTGDWLVACQSTWPFLTALFALWQTGRRPVIPPNFQEGILAHRASTVSGVLADSATPSDCATPWLQNQPVLDAWAPPIPSEDVGLVAYTSGSAGEPKPIQKNRMQIDAEITALEQVWGGDGVTRVLGAVPHHHIYGLWFRLLWPLAAGRTISLVPCHFPEQAMSALAEGGPAWLVASPSQLVRWPELQPLFGFGAARRIFSSGAPLPAAAAEQYQQVLGRAPTEIFGSTETGGIAWRDQGRDAAFTPLPGVAVALHADGALQVSAPWILPSPYVTSDGAVFLANGRFELTGRLDRVIKLAEKRLSLPEMEARLLAHAWVTEAAVVLIPGRRPQLGAVMVLNSAGEACLEKEGRRELANVMRAHLGRFYDAVLLPRRWRMLAALPRNNRGKLTEAALLACFDLEGGDAD